MVDIWLKYFAQRGGLGGMGRRRTRLIVSARQQAELERWLRSGLDARSRERVQVVLWAATGKHTLEDLARRSGRVRATIQLWLGKFKRGGVAGLLKRGTPPGSISPIRAGRVQTQLRAGWARGRWRTAREVATWLREAHGIERARKSIYYWLAKERQRAEPRNPSRRTRRQREGNR